MLKSWQIILVRPRASDWEIQLTQLGATALVWSPMILVPKIMSELALTQAEQLLLKVDWIFITSPSAIQFLAPALKQIKPRAKIVTMGMSSTQAVQALGWPVYFQDSGNTSESLLASELWQRVQGEQIAIIAAPNGRTLIAQTLVQRGAKVHWLYTYQAQLNSSPMPAIIKQTYAKRIWIVTSANSLYAMWNQLTEIEQVKALTRPIVVISARLKILVQALGFKSIWTSAPDITQIIQTLKHIIK